MLLWLFILNRFQKWCTETVEPGHLIRSPISWPSNMLIKLSKQIGRVSPAGWLCNWGFYLMQPYLARAPIICLALSLSVIYIHTNTGECIRETALCVFLGWHTFSAVSLESDNKEPGAQMKQFSDTTIDINTNFQIVLRIWEFVAHGFPSSHFELTY